jgi:REP element-mobilizing transposase RayT
MDDNRIGGEKNVSPLQDSARPNRRSIRLRGYDYSKVGAYFVTICAQNRTCLFGEIVDGGMRLNDAGQMVQLVWNEMPAFYPGVETDEFVVMPNHIHGIIILVGAAPRGRPVLGQARGPAPTMSLGDVVQRFKTMTTKRYADAVKQSGWSPFSGRLWQRNYYEHIVRNDDELNRIREYIVNNPLQWALDRDNPNGQYPTGQPQGVDSGQPQGVAPTGMDEP